MRLFADRVLAEREFQTTGTAIVKARDAKAVAVVVEAVALYTYLSMSMTDTILSEIGSNSSLSDTQIILNKLLIRSDKK